MNANDSIFNKTLGLIWLAVVLSCSNSHAQKVKFRTPPFASPPSASPSPTPPLKLVNSQPISPDKFAAYQKDKYQIVFTTGYEGNTGFYQKPESQNQVWFASETSALDNFINRLNEFGKYNYSVAAVLPLNQVAIVSLDESPHEYSSFETKSSVFFSKARLDEKLGQANENGFRLLATARISSYCEASGTIARIERCTYWDRYLLDKQANGKKKVEQLVVWTTPGWGAKPSEALQQLISQQLDNGFYPTNVISSFEIVLDKAVRQDDLQSEKPDVQVVRSTWSDGDFEKKVNKLAKDGYRIALVNNQIATMYRNNQTKKVPVSYVWVRTDKKDFDQELAKLQTSNATYRAIYPSEKGKMNTLIFEQPLTTGGNNSRVEFRTFALEFEEKENAVEKTVSVELSPQSKEALRQINESARQGFVVRDLFYSDKINVLLERQSN